MFYLIADNLQCLTQLNMSLSICFISCNYFIKFCLVCINILFNCNILEFSFLIITITFSSQARF